MTDAAASAFYDAIVTNAFVAGPQSERISIRTSLQTELCELYRIKNTLHDDTDVMKELTCEVGPPWRIAPGAACA